MVPSVVGGRVPNVSRAGAELSVVVASLNARDSVCECLEVLERQTNGSTTELIVADNSTDGTDDLVARQFPDVKLISSPTSRFIPELWEVGISQSVGDIVAITTAHCVPEPHWVQEILRAHRESSYAGIGGAIENKDHAGLVQWAIYFCRYAPYMRPFEQRLVRDIPGDNASYKRLALERCRQSRKNGFWEPEVHAELLREGFQLLLTPAIGIYHDRSFSFSGFMKQRFLHGRRFGMDRAKHISKLRQFMYVLLSPLIPIVLLRRIGRHVFARHKHVREFVFSSPLLVLFLVSWSAGELSGGLRTFRS